MINTIRCGSLMYLEADTVSAPHCFTTRLGGVSTGHLASMNIGIHRGDTRENLLKNYQLLGASVGFDPRQLVMTTQTHTDIVLTVDRQHWGAGLFAPELPQCDALITNTPGTALAVFTADCTPIVLYDPVTGAVGAAHAGWRGTAAAIGAKTVEAMVRSFGCRRENIRAAIGPNIAQCCFETDLDVPDAMVQTYGSEAKAHIRPAGEKYYVNLKELNALSLRQAGVVCIDISPLCTACRQDLFWSHRRVGKNRGSQGGIILCKEAGT